MRSYWMLMTEHDTVLECRDVPVPDPGPGQLRLRMAAAGLNRGEFVVGHGLHGKAGTWKAIGGEGAGVVDAIGPDVSGFVIGDRVMGRCTGAFSSCALIDVAEAMPIPDALDDTEAAAIPLTFLVAYDMLVLQGRLSADEWLLINGVSSGVGVASLQLGKAIGARVIGTSGSADKLALLRPLGLDAAIATRTPDFAPEVLRITDGHGADLAINAVGGTVFAEDIRALAFEGRLATVGYVDGILEAPLDLGALHAKRLTLFGVSNKLRSKAQRAAAVAPFTRDILPMFADGRLRPWVDQVVDFDALPAAKARMEAAGHVGKIVLKISGGV